MRIPGIGNFKIPNPLNLLRGNPANPVNMAGNVTKMQTDAQNLMAQAQGASILSIISGSGDPGFFRLLMTKAAAVIGLMLTIFPYYIQRIKDDRESTKSTHKLAEPAR